MKLGVLSAALGDMNFADACTWLKDHGAEMIETGSGGYPGNVHCNPDLLLESGLELDRFRETLKRSGLEISAFSCHGNMVHPDASKAAKFREDFQKTLRLAEKMGVHTVNTFSGCPGGGPSDSQPNWVTCPWPEEYSEILDYQWNDVLIPFWKKQAEEAQSWGVDKIALELHPGFCVYNTRTMLRLRQEAGKTIGANLDPSHLIWQGMDPALCIRELSKEGALFHFHAKDTAIDPYQTARNGVLDTEHYSNETKRSWIFRTVGYGHGEDYWKNLVSQLRLAGYDGAVSIEHEVSLMSGREGLEKAIRFLQRILIREKAGDMYWA